MPNVLQSTTVHEGRADTLNDPSPLSSALNELQDVLPESSECKVTSSSPQESVLPLWTPLFFRIARKQRNMPPISPVQEVPGGSDTASTLDGQSAFAHTACSLHKCTMAYP
jgi:hypothetical protein